MACEKLRLPKEPQRIYDLPPRERRLERIRLLKDFFHSSTPQICLERALLYTKAYKETEGQPIALRRAQALKKCLEEMTLYLLPGQLFVGNHAEVPNGASLYPEYSVDWIKKEINEFEKRNADRYLVRREDKLKILKIADEWRGKTTKDRILMMLPQDVVEAQNHGFLSIRGMMDTGDGHITVDYKKVLEKGIEEIIKESDDRLRSLKLKDPEEIRKIPFIKSIPIVLKAAIKYAERYATLASDMAKIKENRKRKEELGKIAEVCRKVPRKPAKSFYEALQSILFTQYILQIESNGHSFCPGRVDQYCYSYYEKDLKEGKITKNEALELIDCWFIMFNYVRKLRPWSHTKYHAGNPTYQGITLGGQTRKRKNASNELTFLMMEAANEVRMPQPELKLRWFLGTPEVVLNKAAEIAKQGFGMPAFLGDEAIVPSLCNIGIDIEDARDYVHDGCVVPQIPGKQSGRSAGTHFLNIPKILNEVIHNSKTFDNYDDLWECFVKRLNYYVGLVSIGEDCCSLAIQELVPDPFCSALVDDCIKRGLSTVDGGTIYEFQSGNQVGLQHTADSLMAIKKLIFENRLLSFEKLKRALENNFEGSRAEEIRRMCLSTSKYGDDEDEVDEIVAKIIETFNEMIKSRRTIRFGKGPIPCRYVPSTSTVTAGLGMGLQTGATADGRKSGESLTEGISPVHGRPSKGPTAVMKSVAKTRADLVTGGHLLNLRLTSSVVKAREGTQKLTALIRSFFELGGWHVQFNMVSTETLRKAQKNPRKYNHIMVRVAGYCARFVDLSPETQAYIMEREEHS